MDQIMKRILTFLMLLLLGVQGYGQNQVSFDDGVLYMGDSIISVNEFKVLLEAEDLLTRQNYFLIRGSEQNQSFAQAKPGLVTTGLLFMASYIPTYNYFNNGNDIWDASAGQIIYGLASLAAVPIGGIFVLNGVIPYQSISEKQMNKVIARYNEAIQTKN